MPSYIPQDKSHHPATSENHQYSSRRHPSMDNISPIQQLPLSTSYFVPSVSDPVHTEPRGKLLEKKENPPASPDFIWIAQWSRASRNGQTLPEKLFWKEVSDISCLCPPTILLGSPVGASDFLGWLLKEETSPLFSVAPLGMGSILLFQRSPPHRLPALCLLRSSWPRESFPTPWCKDGWTSLYQEVPAERPAVVSLLLWGWEHLIPPQPFGESRGLQCCCWHRFQELGKL